eukprot:gnl/MRDRNA2_/MRDRNA2_18453_c0_seq1.p1 gnl/MRDRNA2_/MRDRNA2_18453_c0~~gnl/MRDRNA2_/MRDRNA2_18453_c0_seq1.p1  ORF type:complete len:242 (+),score=52.97 gnl/MRDRNA2_/MRDRNA2_18453_c0_seq1:86-727(+)
MAASGDLKTHPKTLELRNTDGVVCTAEIYYASQQRWTQCESAPRAAGQICIVSAAEDAQAAHIWNCTFPSKAVPPQTSDTYPQVFELDEDLDAESKTAAYTRSESVISIGIVDAETIEPKSGVSLIREASKCSDGLHELKKGHTEKVGLKDAEESVSKSLDLQDLEDLEESVSKKVDRRDLVDETAVMSSGPGKGSKPLSRWSLSLCCACPNS